MEPWSFAAKLVMIKQSHPTGQLPQQSRIGGAPLRHAASMDGVGGGRFANCVYYCINSEECTRKGPIQKYLCSGALTGLQVWQLLPLFQKMVGG